jgi:hypothetical protein
MKLTALSAAAKLRKQRGRLVRPKASEEHRAAALSGVFGGQYG